MDNHPVHYGTAEVGRARTDMTRRLCTASRWLGLSPAPGATLFPHFIGEVFISFPRGCPAPSWPRCTSGDTLYPALTITGLEPKGDDGIVVTAATVSQPARGQLVLSGQHKYLLGGRQRGPYATAMAEHQSPPIVVQKKQPRGGMCAPLFGRNLQASSF